MRYHGRLMELRVVVVVVLLLMMMRWVTVL